MWIGKFNVSYFLPIAPNIKISPSAPYGNNSSRMSSKSKNKLYSWSEALSFYIHTSIKFETQILNDFFFLNRLYRSPTIILLQKIKC